MTHPGGGHCPMPTRYHLPPRIANVNSLPVSPLPRTLSSDLMVSFKTARALAVCPRYCDTASATEITRLPG